MRYFSNISTAIKTTFKGMALAINYFFDARKKRKKEWLNDDNYFEKAEGTFTIQYPQESIPVPDHGRYQLHNEINDCIVCDKCSKICPVDCIDIEPVRSPEVFGQTSDGTPLRVHAAKFDIDMAKCCFCGLCTVVCPTECLTMTKEYDFTTTNILDHNFSFSKMSDSEIAEKKKEFEDYQAAKAKPKEALPAVGKKPLGKPTMKPMAKPIMKKGATSLIKPKISSPESKSESEQGPPAKQAVKPVLKPTMKPVIKPKISSPESKSESEQGPPAKQAVKPVLKP
ncbi:MAG: 4Fe-4S dicluster domain-containing protein, partial [Bacteroidota bacterium]